MIVSDMYFMRGRGEEVMNRETEERRKAGRTTRKKQTKKDLRSYLAAVRNDGAKGAHACHG